MGGRHFIPAKTVMPIFSLSPVLVAMTPQATTTATCIFMQPQEVQAQLKLEQSETVTNVPTFCNLCTPVCRKYPYNYTSLNHSEWSDPEEVEDWNGKREKENEHKKKESKEKEKEQDNIQKELKQKPITTSYYPLSPQYTPSYESKNHCCLENCILGDKMQLCCAHWNLPASPWHILASLGGTNITPSQRSVLVALGCDRSQSPLKLLIWWFDRAGEYLLPGQKHPSHLWRSLLVEIKQIPNSTVN